MGRRVTPSQFNSMVRRLQQQQRQAVSKANREIQAYNRKVRQTVDKYNREARAHNTRVRANRQRLRNELARLKSKTTSTRYATFRVSVEQVQTTYERLEYAADAGRLDERYNEVLDLSEREAANNAGLMNALLGDALPGGEGAPDAADSPLTPVLQAISSDLAARWGGAVFSLSPRNPDAARHFCTSAREIIAGILNLRAPDANVAGAMPDCDRTDKGTPTRRAKIRYILWTSGIDEHELEAFVEADMDNVVQLFQVFNKGTHGEAGAFDLAQLRSIRRRVEDGIMFLARIAGYSPLVA